MYCPDAEMDTEDQYLEPRLVTEFQVLPKSVDMYMYPLVTATVWYCPDAEMDTEHQYLEPRVVAV